MSTHRLMLLHFTYVILDRHIGKWQKKKEMTLFQLETTADTTELVSLLF